MPVNNILIIYSLVLASLYLLYYFGILDHKSRLFISCLIVFEGFNSVLSLGSYLPEIMGLALIFIGFYFLNLEINKIELSDGIVDFISINYKIVRIFPYLGALGIVLIFIFNNLLLDDDTYGSNDYLAILFCIILFFYERINPFNPYIVNFSLITLFVANILLIFPRVLIFATDGSINETFDNEIVYIFLNRPVNIVLSGLGYEVFSDSSLLKFYTVNGQLEAVDIGRTCSGLHSVAIFISGFTSYAFLQDRKISSSMILFILFGVFLSYLANLLRILIIVLVGIYIDLNAMLWVHAHLGWVIFTIWIFIFWNLYERYNNVKTISNTFQ